MKNILDNLEEMRILSECDFVYVGTNIHKQLAIRFYKDKEVFEKRLTFDEIVKLPEDFDIHRYIAMEAKEVFKQKLGVFNEHYTPMLETLGFVFPKN